MSLGEIKRTARFPAVQGPDYGAKTCSFVCSFESSFEYFSNSFVKEVFKGAFKGLFKGAKFCTVIGTQYFPQSLASKTF